MSANQILSSSSGLLPPGNFDPQIQRLLKALENPDSSESVALLRALFARSEGAAKDVPFFEHFCFGSREPEVEARDSVCQLFRELCRKHGAVFENCPLLQPLARKTQRACQLVDASNTILELRANLTEPFARAGAAFAMAESDDANES